MIIGGLQKLSLLDYPDHIAAIVFTQGCNFRCHFCYNPMLVLPNREDRVKYQKDHLLIPEGDLFDFLKSRVEKIESVVITGGEPTIHFDLPRFINEIKQLGFKIKLDTNGTNPEMLEELIKGEFINYLAMDIKAPENKYEEIAGVGVNFAKIKKSIKIIMNSGLPYEFRTTVMPDLLNKNDIKVMGGLIEGADKWFLQKFKSNMPLVDGKFKEKQSFTDKEMGELREIARKYVKKCEIR